jgi:acetylornithine deacetylase
MLPELAAELIAVDSVNPTLVPDGGGEAVVARVLAEWLERAGLEVEIEEVVPGRPNVIGVARGSGGGRTLMLNGHLDTVGLLISTAAFPPASRADAPAAAPAIAEGEPRGDRERRSREHGVARAGT